MPHRPNAARLPPSGPALRRQARATGFARDPIKEDPTPSAVPPTGAGGMAVQAVPDIRDVPAGTPDPAPTVNHETPHV
ncbi:MAG: hypothetical protein IT542_12555 [Rubellimicrobium sp.]|nr:hypothetical protein [Rubellimicrobium sp.]